MSCDRESVKLKPFHVHASKYSILYEQGERIQREEKSIRVNLEKRGFGVNNFPKSPN